MIFLESQVFTVHHLIDYGNANPIQLNRCLHLSDSIALKQGTLQYEASEKIIKYSEGKLIKIEQQGESFPDGHLVRIPHVRLVNRKNLTPRKRKNIRKGNMS